MLYLRKKYNNIHIEGKMKYNDYFERKRHGSPDFPIQYYHVDTSNPQYVMAPHWHNEFEIIRVLEGEFKVFLNTSEYLLHKNEILLVECGCLHRGEPFNCVYECLVFDFDMLCRQQNDSATKYIAPLKSVMVSQPHFSPQDNELYQTVCSLFAAQREKNEYYELSTYAHLFKLSADLYTQNRITIPSQTQLGNKKKAIPTILDFIENNLTETITLDKLSAISGLSKKYLCRIFKEYASVTIVDYINELRIENACYEMSVQGKNVTQAALESGFNDLSYFCKIFKKYKGITPKEYQKNSHPTHKNTLG